MTAPRDARVPELLTYREAARLVDPTGALGVTHRSIARHVAQGRLNRVKIGRRAAVVRAELTGRCSP